jgi:hypothetical protein
MIPPVDPVENLCRNLDRLMTVEARLSDYSRGVIRHLYEAACAAQGGGPLCMLAARLILEHAKPGQLVFIATGAGDAKFMPAGETDGPLGACALALAIIKATGAIPILLTETIFQANLAAVALAASLGVRDPVLALETPFATTILPIAADDSAMAQAAGYLERFKPTLLIAVEKSGPGRDGFAYRASGNRSPATRGHTEHLFDQAAALGIASLGIGDNGNEIGYGLIEEAVRTHKPKGDKIATRVATTVLVAANTSNWGAYAVCAALAALCDRADVFHDAAMERRMLEACVAANGADGSTGRHVLAVDGTPAEVQEAIVTMMGAIVRNGLLKGYKRPF